MTTMIFGLACEATFVVYVFFAALVILRGARTWLGGLLIAAAGATALWAQSSVAVNYGFLPPWLEVIAGGLRDFAWLALCLGLMYRRGGYTTLWLGMLSLTTALAVLQFVLDLGHINAGAVAGVHLDGALIRVAATVLGMVLVENILRNSMTAEFWSLKHLLIGLIAILAFQFVSRVPEFLTHSPDPDMIIAQPFVFLLVLPLFVVSSVRIPNLQLRVHSSRAFVFHTATLVIAGIMLQGVAVAAWYVRDYGGSNGTALAVILLFGGAVAIAIALVSSGLRSRVRQFINENFFSLKYDYRLEWEKVIRALSLNPEQGSAERVLRTFCDLLDSPGGAIWIHRASWHQFLPAAKLGFNSDFLPIFETDPRVELFRSHDKALLALTGPVSEPAESEWQKAFGSEWIAVPLRYRSAIIALMVLQKPRAPRSIDWEDENLVRLVALQLGAYLVQEETAQSLADARQLEEFNKRFAFVVHDIKNTIGQLGLLVRNAGQFGHEQEFRDDMVITLRNAVERLQELLTGLSSVGTNNVPGNRSKQAFDLIEFLSEFTKGKGNLGQRMILRTNCPSLELELTDITNLRRVLEHVAANALEASAAGEAIEIFVSAEPNSVEIKIADHGAGMTEKFINEELFRPMRTTKDGGFGIGAYQARELMRDLGGDIHVASKIGVGTSVTLSLPRHQPQGTRAG